ncbi:uncharacterized protein Gasu_45430 [Galdieria sulphuraria]|uniref:BAR domain-containing protein n=1 Tax=Galdieria sulphuraria TaxID=130081 RepID=M2XW96_GALSU|nr:uncharacterized protein Gasu_45430 [Galdieria sulphuraria]EME27878.1 hypothetical protein Gasu_45430 [Galdieria sulphuraria]|eukprot:XP_005704398.1 hypothetical protein Gasu_45430 [Galdieria sulphuraria]
MPPVTSLFGSSPKTVNLEIEHWMNNLNEVQSVINTVEPKLNTTPTKWKAVFQHVKEVSEELSQIFNKEDPHYDVILAGVNAGRKFDSAQAEIAKSDSVRDSALNRLRKYRDEIEVLRREYKEREKVRERYDHYRVKLDNLERKGKDQPRIERNQQKLKDAEDSYHAVTAEVIQKMETCWKKHVEVFAEASIALWYMQMRMVDEFAQTSEDVRPFVDDYLKNMKSSNTSFPNQDYMGEDASAAKHTKDPLANNDSTLDTDNAFPCLEEDDKQESAPEKYPSIQSLTA